MTKRTLVKLCLVLLCSLHGRAQMITNIQLLSYPNDTFKLAVISQFPVGDVTCCLPLSGFQLTPANDTIHVEMFSENVLCVQMFCTREDTITLGQVLPFTKNAVMVHPATAMEVSTGVWDTTWAPQFDTLALFPWANSVSAMAISAPFEIMPIPARNELFVSSSRTPMKDADIYIYDMHGREVLVQKRLSLTSAPLQIDISIIPSGLYIITLRTKAGTLYRQRILKVE